MRLKIALGAGGAARALRAGPASNSNSRRAARRELAQTLTQRLQAWTGERWMVSLVTTGGAPTLTEQREAAERERRSAAWRPIRWSRACSRVFPARRSSPCAARTEAAPIAAAGRRGYGYDDASPIRKTIGDKRQTMDFMGMMKQAQAMQAKMAEAQAELEQHCWSTARRAAVS